jgi:hypothetical protein
MPLYISMNLLFTSVVNNKSVSTRTVVFVFLTESVNNILKG